MGAAWWQREYTDGADVEYEEQIIPLVAEHLRGTRRRMLDVGCGEGQVARRLAAAGVDVIGLDPSGAQIARGARTRRRAAGTRVPVPSNSRSRIAVSTPCSYASRSSTSATSPAAVREIARVLAPGGRLLLLVGHPLLQAPGSGWIDDKVLDERYWRIGEYLREHAVVDEVAPGVTFEFVHRPVFVYVNTLARSGCSSTTWTSRHRPAALIDANWGYPEADTIPRILVLHAGRRRLTCVLSGHRTAEERTTRSSGQQRAASRNSVDASDPLGLTRFERVRVPGTGRDPHVDRPR